MTDSEVEVVAQALTAAAVRWMEEECATGSVPEWGDVPGDVLARAAIAAMPQREGWRDIASAPKDAPILGWCVHGADPYHLENGKLTLYGAHAEGLSHAEDGINILVWGGSFDDSSHEDPSAAWLPDWWFVRGSDFETAANPTHWMPLPAAPIPDSRQPPPA